MNLTQALEQSVLDMEINDDEMAVLTQAMQTTTNDNALISLRDLIRMIEELQDDDDAARASFLARLRTMR